MDSAADYSALAEFVRAEMDRQSLQPKDIEERGGPSWPTLNSIVKAEPAERRPATLRELSTALGYPPQTALRVLQGQPVEPAIQSPSDDLVSILLDIRSRVMEIEARLDEGEGRSRRSGERRDVGGSR